jgi:hypothetical protein
VLIDDIKILFTQFQIFGSSGFSAGLMFIFSMKAKEHDSKEFQFVGSHDLRMHDVAIHEHEFQILKQIHGIVGQVSHVELFLRVSSKSFRLLLSMLSL